MKKVKLTEAQKEVLLNLAKGRTLKRNGWFKPQYLYIPYTTKRDPSRPTIGVLLALGLVEDVWPERETASIIQLTEAGKAEAAQLTALE